MRNASRHDVIFKEAVERLMQPGQLQKGLSWTELPIEWSYKLGPLMSKLDNFISLDMGEDSEWELVWDDAAMHPKASIIVKVEEGPAEAADDVDSTDDEEEGGPSQKKQKISVRREAEEKCDAIATVIADLLERYKCDQHPMKVCYLKRDQHQTLLPVQTRMWADLIMKAENEDEPSATAEYLPNLAAFQYRPLGTPIRDRSDTPSTPATHQGNFPGGFHASPQYPWPLPYAGYPFLPSPAAPQPLAASTSSNQARADTVNDIGRASEVEGPELSLSFFVSIYKLGDSVAEALEREEVVSPADINHLDYEAYIRDVDLKGLGLRLGSAQRLARAMVAWRKGVDFDGNALE